MLSGTTWSIRRNWAVGFNQIVRSTQSRFRSQGQKVCTTKQLAEFYGCNEKNIKDNYQNNGDRFVEGVHYFKLEGLGLSRFKDGLSENIGQPLKFAPILMIWTEKGAARHARAEIQIFPLTSEQ